MRKLIEQCPGCGQDLLATRLACTECGVEITGRFTPSLFDRLSPESLAFAETFIRLRGNIREMERKLGVPYNAVRGRLDDVISELGFDVAPRNGDDLTPETGPEAEPGSTGTRQQVLTRLDRGEITADEAADLLADLG